SLPPDARGHWDALLRDAATVQPAQGVKDWRVSGEEVPGGLYPDVEEAREAAQEAFHRLQLARVPCSAWKEKMAAHLGILGCERVADCLSRAFHKVPDSKPGMLARNTLNRGLVDSMGPSVPLPHRGAVQLWHPIDATAEEVEAWRDRFEA